MCVVMKRDGGQCAATLVNAKWNQGCQHAQNAV